MKLTGLACALFAIGCASGGGGTGTYFTHHPDGGTSMNPSGVAAFVGTWSWTSGNGTIACGTNTPEMTPPNGTITVAQSGPSEVTVSGPSAMCAARFAVSGTHGTLVPNQPCTSELGMAMLEAGEIGVDGSALTLALNMTFGDGQTTCTYDVSGNLARPK